MLKTLCYQKGYTMAEVSEKAGISRDYLSKLNTGKKENPTIEVIEKISQAIGVSNEEVRQAIRG